VDNPRKIILRKEARSKMTHIHNLKSTTTIILYVVIDSHSEHTEIDSNGKNTRANTHRQVKTTVRTIIPSWSKGGEKDKGK
jgi:hypothetical protein